MTQLSSTVFKCRDTRRTSKAAFEGRKFSIFDRTSTGRLFNVIILKDLEMIAMLKSSIIEATEYYQKVPHVDKSYTKLEIAAVRLRD